MYMPLTIKEKEEEKRKHEYWVGRLLDRAFVQLQAKQFRSTHQIEQRKWISFFTDCKNYNKIQNNNI